MSLLHESSKVLLFAAETFDAAKFLDTHPDLVNRAYNRPRMETLKSQTMSNRLDDETLAVGTIQCFHVLVIIIMFYFWQEPIIL